MLDDEGIQVRIEAHRRARRSAQNWTLSEEQVRAKAEAESARMEATRRAEMHQTAQLLDTFLALMGERGSPGSVPLGVWTSRTLLRRGWLLTCDPASMDYRDGYSFFNVGFGLALSKAGRLYYTLTPSWAARAIDIEGRVNLDGTTVGYNSTIHRKEHIHREKVEKHLERLPDGVARVLADNAIDWM